MGFMFVNFKCGRGDYVGIVGRFNDGVLIILYIYEYFLNDYGFYNMVGNVSEWVQDVYCFIFYQDFDDFNLICCDGFFDLS